MLSFALKEISLTPNCFANTAPTMEKFLIFYTKSRKKGRKCKHGYVCLRHRLSSSPDVRAVLIQEQRTSRKRMCLDARFL